MNAPGGGGAAIAGIEPQVRPGAWSWDEFSPLREVVVGDATGSRVPPMDRSAWLTCYPELTVAELASIEAGLYPAPVVEESNEDLAVLVQTLEELGVQVHQPPAPDHGAEFGGPGWQSSGRSSYCPRDLAMVFGPAIVESASPMRARYHELAGLRPLFQDYFRRGARWIAAPRPVLANDLYEYDAEGAPVLGEAEIAFEAANCLRLGRDVLYQVSRSGNELGLRWLESTLGLLGDVRVHPLRGLYAGTHIDSTIALLRPGLVLLNPERVTPDTVPEPLKGWDVLWCPPMEVGPIAMSNPLSTPWVGMNLLMVDPTTAIVDATQVELVRLLERNGITVVPRTLRHARVLGGGFHCVTLDTVRDGEAEDYLG
ncbi:scyllo-inosamine-4-phosphate amidinotransferase [Oerskovia sp. Sa1BUA8]|uniref:Scyllo-inosamine-4-phosphate amidinotransferase n=1 Tax=Oerskovia douganii TaxID=2762210 RepID=A0A9D5UCV8_9CELL|nr:scyllo-inosamine-4-phosphate amidinotransferase [Oerskovia douganii]MBE7702230.1 scyllo-inosamine-4-phosphate amidinotransferase [Oerskovia douganii]